VADRTYVRGPGGCGGRTTMPVSTTFHSSMTQSGPKSSGRMVASSPKPSITETGAPSEVTETAFSRWKVELHNKLVVEQEKSQMVERKKYKQHEDGKFWERKQNLHKKTSDQFGKAKMEVEAVRQANLTKGAEYKAELEEMKEMAAQQREEWMQFGHELTVQHGPEQAERTKARLAETAEAKAEMGRQVKQEAQLNNKQRHTQRTNQLEQKRELVEATKQEEFSVPEESKNFSFHQKEEKGGEVRRTERKWKSLSKQEREAFLSHAHENHEKAVATKEHMRDMRNDVVKRNKDAGAEERTRKLEDAMRITELKEEKETANRALRDAMYTARYAEPGKAKLMSQSLQEAAEATGVAQLIAPPGPSPYRIA